MATTTALTGADQQVITAGGGPGHYYGFTVEESTSIACHFRVHDGTSNSGKILDTVKLAVGETAREWYGPQGIQYQLGIYVDVVAGTPVGTIRHG